MIAELLSKYKVVIGNVISLSILQALNYILPLVTVPYLVRILGPEKYGIIIFASAFICYFQIITDYGFNMSATRSVSINKSNKEKLNEIFSSVMLIKIILTILCFVSLLIIVFSVSQFRYNYKVYILLYGMVVGNLLSPIWFFQGMEQMKYITGINVVIKFFLSLFIFVLIRKESHYLLVVYLNSISYILIGVTSLWIVLKKFNIKFKIYKLNIIKSELKEGWYIFTTSFFSNILTTSGIFVLGLFSSKEIVGYYGAIDKIVKALVLMFSPITQAVFPHVSATFKKSFFEGEKEIIKLAKIILPFVTVLCILLYMFNRDIVFILYGHNFAKYTCILKYMTFWIFLSILNNFLGIQYLIGSGNSKYYSRSFVMSAITTLVLFITLIKSNSFNAIIIGTSLGELVLTLVMICYIKFKIKKEFTIIN